MLLSRTARFVRSERNAAVLLLVGALAGLLIANSSVGPGIIGALSDHLAIPTLALDLSANHWVSDGLLAVFFFIVAVELKRELVIGELNSASRALLPAIAALGGVIVPALIYLAIAGPAGLAQGWPIPTATDIAFAIGVLAVFGRAIPNRVRVFLLALAVLDDLVAILLIAVFFTTNAQPAYIAVAALTTVTFGLLSSVLRPRSPWILNRRAQWPIVTALVVLAVLTWYLTYQSGVHPTIAGVALGLAASRRPGGRAAHILEPFSSGIVLPLFALTAAMVPIPTISLGKLSPAFWAIVVALPVGKIIGIGLAGVVSGRVARRKDKPSLEFADIAVIGALGGIGFTVSLLMNALAFGSKPEIVDEGTLAVLAGSGVAIVLSAALVTLRSRHYQQQKLQKATAPPTQ